MNLVEPFLQETVDRDMSSTATLSFTLFIGAAMGGFYLLDLFQRWKKTEERVGGLEEKMNEAVTLQENQAEALQEHEQRIREKQDYDESEEIEEKKYQAWRGECAQENGKVEIDLWREKETKIKDNQEWVVWNGEENGSTTVRDFYLGNLHPDFQWEIREGSYYYGAKASESFVENWDNVIRLEITITFDSQEHLLAFVQQTSFRGNSTINLALKNFLEVNGIQWNRVLVNAK
jgi:low affinity Fe/Cu permease